MKKNYKVFGLLLIAVLLVLSIMYINKHVHESKYDVFQDDLIYYFEDLKQKYSVGYVLSLKENTEVVGSIEKLRLKNDDEKLDFVLAHLANSYYMLTQIDNGMESSIGYRITMSNYFVSSTDIVHQFMVDYYKYNKERIDIYETEFF